MRTTGLKLGLALLLALAWLPARSVLAAEDKCKDACDMMHDNCEKKCKSVDDPDPRHFPSDSPAKCHKRCKDMIDKCLPACEEQAKKRKKKQKGGGGD